MRSKESGHPRVGGVGAVVLIRMENCSLDSMQ